MVSNSIPYCGAGGLYDDGMLKISWGRMTRKELYLLSAFIASKAFQEFRRPRVQYQDRNITLELSAIYDDPAIWTGRPA